MRGLFFRFFTAQRPFPKVCFQMVALYRVNGKRPEFTTEKVERLLRRHFSDFTFHEIDQKVVGGSSLRRRLRLDQIQYDRCPAAFQEFASKSYVTKLRLRYSAFLRVGQRVWCVSAARPGTRQ